ncbi:phage scaffolding protein [Veillonella rogosae]|uniref:phage scaffolding protein n=1 Tax=Veillonella rogosae TaxID=423477 RepID=UPI0006D1CA31|nr:phage scaffolding protein [Veillonella rogosae]
MTKEQLLALNLTEDQVTAIIEDYGKNYVSKSQFNEKNDAYKQAKQEIENLTNDINTLSKANEANEALQQQIKDLQDAAQRRESDYLESIKTMKIDTAIAREVLEAGAMNTTILTGLLDRSKITYDNETITGIQEQIKSLKESDPYLFKQDSIKGVIPGGEATPKTDNGLTKEQFNKLSYKDRVALQEQDPDLYNELSHS